jgi:hypothetical protein
MNLQQVTAGIVGAVNPLQPAAVYQSTGPGPTQPDGGRVPTYAQVFTATIQVQPITTGDLRKLESLNIQGVSQKVYMTGELSGLIRVRQLGGDILVLKDGTSYLVRAVLEQWSISGVNWVSAAIVLQNDTNVGFLSEPRF